MSTENPEGIWARQYPYGGFCFGPDKPTVHIIQEKGQQVVKFEGSALNGEIRKCLYPNFSLDHWWKLVHNDLGAEWLRRLGVDDREISDQQASPDVYKRLIGDLAPGERNFISLYQYYCPYARSYNPDGSWEAPDWIPAVIPQVWIQWHSDPVEELKKWGSPYSSQPHRIDFAMFWNNQRVAILIDGIQHYASKEGSRWIASELEYSKRLIEDRFLQMNDWRVFRISNWELRDYRDDFTRAAKVMSDLEQFVGFEFKTDWGKTGVPHARPRLKPVDPPF